MLESVSDAKTRCRSILNCFASTSFLLTDLVFQRRDLFFHLTQAHMSDYTGRFIEKINNAAWCAAKQDDEKTHRADKLGYGNLDMAKIAEQYLKNLFTQSNAGEADWQCGNGAFHRQHRKKINHGNSSTKGVGDTKEGCKRGKMRN